jgi:integrase
MDVRSRIMPNNNPYPGIRIKGNSIEIEIKYKGKRYRPSLKMKPTASNIKEAISIKESIRRDITIGKLNINEYFSDSKILEYFPNLHVSNITISEMLDIWLENYLKGKDYDPKEYKGYIKNRLIPFFGKIRIKDLTPRKVRDFQEMLVGEVSNKSINNYMIPLRQSFELAFIDEMIEENILDRVKNLPIVKQKVIPLNIDQVNSVLNSMKHVPDYFNYYQFALWTGLSTGEQLGLKWIDINLEDKKIHINRMYGKKGIRPVKTKYRKRCIELIQPAIDALVAQKKLNYDSEWVFIDPNNKKHTNLPWTSRKIAIPWNKALEENNTHELTAYGTRHTYSSIMLSAGMTLEWLKNKLGHSNYKMLEEVYASWTEVSSSERKKIREWIFNESLNGHIPEMEKEYFQKDQ